MRCAILDQHGYVVTLGDFDKATHGMVPVPDGMNIPFLQYKIRCAGGVFVVTDKPALPPKPWLLFDGAKGEWVDARSEAQRWEAVRVERQKLLMATDWTTLPDVPMSQELRDQWTAYRQALRDVTDQPDPLNITWPVPPSN